MRKLLLLLILLCSTVFVTGQTLAVTITLDPMLQTILPGDTAIVDLNISGLGNFVTPTLGAFDLDVTFDASLLSFTDVTFGTFLGDPALFEAITLVDFSAGGLLELSLLSSIALDAIQPDAFTLATLEFTGIGVGTSPLNLENVVLSDALGFVISNPTLENASVNVIASVPEPSPSLLMGISLLGLLGYGWRQRRKKQAA